MREQFITKPAIETICFTEAPVNLLNGYKKLYFNKAKSFNTSKSLPMHLMLERLNNQNMSTVGYLLKGKGEHEKKFKTLCNLKQWAKYKSIFAGSVKKPSGTESFFLLEFFTPGVLIINHIQNYMHLHHELLSSREYISKVMTGRKAKNNRIKAINKMLKLQILELC